MNSASLENPRSTLMELTARPLPVTPDEGKGKISAIKNAANYRMNFIGFYLLFFVPIIGGIMPMMERCWC